MKHESLISLDEAAFGFGTPKAVFEATSATNSNAADCITVPDAGLLFNGEFKRSGDDLKIVGDDGKSFLVSDYFKNDKRPTLLSPEGAALTGDVVSALAGPLAPGQYAQAGTPQSAGQAIGRVEKVDGNATVVRNGVTITLNTGDVIQKGDVAQTGAGGSLAIVFADGTAFNLAANARMVLNDFVYSAGGSNNSALISLVQGSISFVAGQVAKTGDMRVDTPVATMGIRGTALLIEIDANNGQTKFSVMMEPNGITGSAILRQINPDGSLGAVIGTLNNSAIGWVVTPAGPLQVIAQQIQKTPAELAMELAVVQQVFQTFNAGQNNPFDPNAPQGPQQPTDPGKRGDVNPQNSPGGSGTPGGTPIDPIKVTVTPQGGPGSNGTPNNPNAGDPTNTGPTGPDDGTPQIFEFTPPSNTSPFIISGPVVTRVSDPSEDGGHAFAPDISADGRWIVFDPAEDFEAGGKVFIYDRFDPDAGPVEISDLIEDAPDNETYGGPSISLDGRFVVFQGDGGEGEFSPSRIYIYNVETGDVEFLYNGGNAHIDGGGNFIIMETGGDLVVVDRDGCEVLSIDAEHDGPGVWSPEIDATGRFITFWTAAEEIEIDGEEFYLVGGIEPDEEPVPQVFLYDRLTGELEAVSALTHLVNP